MGFKRLPLVLVKSVDITGRHKWMSEKQAKKQTPSVLHQVGYLVSNTDASVITAGFLADDGSMSNITITPKGCVKGVRVIEEVE